MDIFEGINASLFMLMLIVTIFYIPLLFRLIKITKQKQARVRFFHAISSVLERVENDEEAINQIQIIYRKLVERYQYTRNQYKSAPDFLEDYLCRIESIGNKSFKRYYKSELNNEQKNRLVKIIEAIKAKQPYSTLSSKHGNILSMINHAFDTNNLDLGKANLQQLSDDIEVLETTIEQQAKNNQISIVVSVVGVILTLVFGALTVVQYIFPPISNG